MSGICGIWRRDDPYRAGETLASLSAGLALTSSEHPSLQCAVGAGVAVTARFTEQQIHNNGRILLVCDADLINGRELSEAVGYKPDGPEGSRTAALMVALYERHGPAFVEKLRGGFSLILWDVGERRLVAAIDGFGIKRLAYYRDKDVLAVASRVDALAGCGVVDQRINPKAIANVLNFTSNLAPETIFAGVDRLSPGTVLVAGDVNTRVDKYWDIRYDADRNSGTARLSRELESVVESSVAVHCGNYPRQELGAFLSGGTDSSAVVGLMSRSTRLPVKAFSIGFDEPQFNELQYAKIAAEKFGAEHHTYLVTAGDCFEALPRILRYFDEPYGNSSAVPTYFCARLAAQHGIRALLAGDGGDELFGGNERYATDKIFEVYHRLPVALRRGLIEPLVAAMPFSGGIVRRARGYIRRANMPGVERMLSFQFLRTHPPAEVFEGDFLESLRDYTVLDIPALHYSEALARGHLNRLLHVDMKITLGDNDLPKVTCMSELAGIQTRFPYLDRTVAEFSGRIPARLKVKGFNKRFLFKRAFRDLLPPEIIRKKKHGFGIPVAHWIRSDRRMRELARDTLLSARAAQRGYFRQSFIEELFRKNELDDSSYHGDTIWTFLALELWHGQVVRQPSKVSI